MHAIDKNIEMPAQLTLSNQQVKLNLWILFDNLLDQFLNSCSRNR